ncbi:hypothetical protein Tco_1372561, partial [Tanacetum coccineum]
AYSTTEALFNNNWADFELFYKGKKDALEYIHKEELVSLEIKICKMNSCTRHFTATMGLPCAHKIKHMKGNVLSLDLVHSHWRIDTISLIPEADSHDDDDAKKVVTLLGELRFKYQVWPLHKKEFATSMITKLVNEQEILFELILFEPVIQRPRGRPPKAKKKIRITSTTRDPSRFEYVESSSMQNPSSSNHENNLIDLNAYPDF